MITRRREEEERDTGGDVFAADAALSSLLDNPVLVLLLLRFHLFEAFGSTVRLQGQPIEGVALTETSSSS